MKTRGTKVTHSSYSLTRLSLYKFAFASIWKYTATNFFFATSEDMPLVLFQASHLDLQTKKQEINSSFLSELEVAGPFYARDTATQFVMRGKG